MGLSSPKIKKFLIFSQKKFFFIFRDMELSKKFDVFSKFFSLYFRSDLSKTEKQKFLMLPEMELSIFNFLHPDFLENHQKKFLSHQ